MDTNPEELQWALFDLQRYLLDQIPPLTASEAVAALMTQPPQVLIREVRSWALEQGRMQTASMSDFLFHALRKVHLVGALKLIDREVADAYLTSVIPLALEACPAEERELLRTNLLTLRDSREIGSATVGVHLTRLESANVVKQSAPTEVTGDVARTARRLSLVIERLSERVASAVSGSATPSSPQQFTVDPNASQLVAMAAASSTSEQELEEYIRTLQPYTGESDPDKLFKVLADGVPKWEIALPRRSAPIEAMHRIIQLTPSVIGAAKRFREANSGRILET